MSSTDPAIRVSRADRDKAIDQLQVAYADGRIDDAELADRTRQALQARTHGDLGVLLADLPRPGVVTPTAPAPRRSLAGGCIDCCVGFVVGICRAVQRLANRSSSR
jgi:hypothetical protein